MKASDLPNPGQLQSSQRLRREVAVAVNDVENVNLDDRRTQLANFFSEVSTYLGGDGGSGGSTTPRNYPERVTERRYGTLGDSRLGLSLFTSGRHAYLKSMGLCHWIDSASMGRAVLDVNAQTAVAGSDTNQMLARLDSDIAKLKAAAVKVVFFIGGTNDYSSSIPTATTRANIVTLMKRLKDEGFLPIAIAETPRRDSDTATIKNTHYALHRWYLDVLAKDYFVVDAWERLTSPGDTRVIVTGEAYDGQHGNPSWQKRLGDAIWSEVAHVFPEASILPTSSTVTMTPNALLTGNTGTIASTVSATGQIATGFTLEGSNADGLTVVASLIEHPLGGQVQVFKVTGQPTKEGAQLSFYVEPSATPAQGSKVKGVAEVAWDNSGIVNCSLNLLSFPKYFSKIDGDAYSTTLQLPTRHRGSRETPVLLMESDATSYRLYVSMTFVQGMVIDSTISVSRMAALPVT